MGAHEDLARRVGGRSSAGDPSARAFSGAEQRLLALLFCAFGAIAQAQVIEVGDGGAVRRIGTGWRTPPSSSTPASAPASHAARYADVIRAAAARYDLSPALLDALARSESNYDAAAVSPAGAIGVMQLMPETARALGVDARDPTQNIFGGAAYLRTQIDRFDGHLDLALAAYNAGDAAVRRHGGVPPYRETRHYVGSNLERLAAAALPPDETPPAALHAQGERP